MQQKPDGDLTGGPDYYTYSIYPGGFALSSLPSTLFTQSTVAIPLKQA